MHLGLVDWLLLLGMPLRFIHTAVRIGALFFFFAEWYSAVCALTRLPPEGIWVAGEWRCYTRVHRASCGRQCSFPQDKYPAVALPPPTAVTL